MSMKYKIKNLDDVAEDLRDLYTKKGDHYVLAIDGIPDAGEAESRIAAMDKKIQELLDEKEEEERGGRDRPGEPTGDRGILEAPAPGTPGADRRRHPRRAAGAGRSG